ncbi:MAG: DUF4097 family beta strand repeat-containing protein [Bacillota bacterium]|nr:DUF4097 family beta strand repeat-containing protein [Bacillota bacterium]
MALSEERLLILKMLEEGKISGEEAAKLLEALDSGNQGAPREEYTKQQKQVNFQSEVEKVKEKMQDWKKEFKENIKTYKQSDFDKSVEDFVDKAEKLGKNVAVTTYGIIDKMVDFVGSFIDTNAFNVFGSYKVEDRSFEWIAAEGMDVEIEGANGNIIVKKHLDNKIIVRSKVRSPQNNADEILGVTQDENKFLIKINKAVNVSVAHEVFVPVIKFKNIKFSTSNGKIYVEDTISEAFECKTRNAHIEIIGVNSDKISLNTKNARIQASYLISKDIDIDTTNATLDIKHVKAEKINAQSTNGRLLAENLQNLENGNELHLNFKTSNAWIKINMNDMLNKGYKVKAQTTNGGVNLLIPQIVYNNLGKQGLTGAAVEAESSNLNDFEQKVFINAETANGYIEIVK